VCYSRGSGTDRRAGSAAVTFGFSPKISTTVENTVEKRGLAGEVRLERGVFGLFSRGEAAGEAGFQARCVTPLSSRR